MTILLLMTVLTALLVALALCSLGGDDCALARKQTLRTLRRTARAPGRSAGNPAIGD